MSTVENPFKGTELERTQCTMNEAAYLIGCHINTVRTLLDRGILTRIKLYSSRGVRLYLSELNRYLAGEVPILKKDTSVAESNVTKIVKPTVKKKPKKRLQTVLTQYEKGKTLQQNPINNVLKQGANLRGLEKEAESQRKKRKKKNSPKVKMKSQNDKARDSIDKSFEKHTNQNTFNVNVVTKKVPPKRRICKGYGKRPEKLKKTNIDYDFDKVHEKMEKDKRKSKLTGTNTRGRK